ncbi:hypothetical protein [Kribbella aluminosa]|uniref:hypothetical protein n=1 Tax=Kribbella aluminosa TaxID=416017 RepID=UPI001AE43316
MDGQLRQYLPETSSIIIRFQPRFTRWTDQEAANQAPVEPRVPPTLRRTRRTVGSPRRATAMHDSRACGREPASRRWPLVQPNRADPPSL